MGSRLALAERKRGDTVAVHEQWGSEATRELRDLYEPLRRFAAVIGRWDVDPDDLVQDAYAKVLRKDPAQIRDLGPYMRRTIANLATDARHDQFVPNLHTRFAANGPDWLAYFR